MRYALQSIGNIIPSVPIPSAINPAAELIFNRNFYTGSTVLGMYEKQTIDSLQYRPQTREIAKVLANFLSNMRGVFKVNQQLGAEKEYLLSPIHIDYLLGAYATGVMQYPFDIINDVSGLKFDKKSFDVINSKSTPFILHHMQGTPKTMQNSPKYKNVLTLNKKGEPAINKAFQNKYLDENFDYVFKTKASQCTECNGKGYIQKIKVNGEKYKNLSKCSNANFGLFKKDKAIHPDIHSASAKAELSFSFSLSKE